MGDTLDAPSPANGKFSSRQASGPLPESEALPMAEVTKYKPNPDTYDGIEVECEFGGDGRPDQLDRVRLRWYEDGSLAVSVRGGAPALLTRCYLEGEGKDVILRFQPA